MSGLRLDLPREQHAGFGDRPYETPAAQRPVRASGPVERVWGNREVLPTSHGAPGSARDPSASTGRA
jgi:hypothetical protein